MAHFTYNDTDRLDKSSLFQGDILQKTKEIEELMIKYHSYYEKYDHFLVLTQSCDLGHNKSAYITIAAVKPLDEFLEKCYGNISNDKVLKDKKIFASGKRNILNDTLCKLLDNNLSEYFFICEDSSCNIYDDYVAFLKLSVALRAEHYQKCLDAKIAELNDVFKAKLGWLVGEMYSRVGTKDWAKNQRKEKISKIVDEEVNWVDSSILNKLKKIISEKEKNKENLDIKVLIDKNKPKSAYDKFLERIETIINNYEKVDKDKIMLLFDLIKNDSVIRGLIK